jgi:hypothetical protein
MPIDLSKLREDAEKIATPARTPEPGIREPSSSPDVAAQRRALQEQRGALNAEAAPPGQEPEADPIDRALHAGRQHPRGSDQAMQAYTSEIFEAAQRGDERVMSQGVINDDTRRNWHDDAHRRQVANRDQSGAAHR